MRRYGNSSRPGKGIRFALGGIALWLFFPVHLMGAVLHHRLEFLPSELRIERVGDYVLPHLSDGEQYWEPGKPALPVVIRRVLLPSGATVSSVRTVQVRFEPIAGAHQVYPVQTPRPVSCALSETQFTSPDSTVYALNDWFPSQIVQFCGTGNKAGFTVADLLVFPIRWHPRRLQLQLLTSLELEIEYTPGFPRLLTARQYARLLPDIQVLVVNPSDAPRFAPLIRPATFADLDYCVVTSPALADRFAPLLDWYQACGLSCAVKTTDWIRSRYPGVDLAEQIRNFIIDYQQNWGLTYVLLAGDTQLVPCRRGRATARPYTDDLPADLYYADLQWSWDGNRNGIWGEYEGDTVDFYADVYVGRAPVDDTIQAASFVRKLLTYELNPARGYLCKILLPYTPLYASYPARGSQDSIASFVPQFWQISLFTGMTTPQPLRDSIQSGFGLAHIVAHGDNTGMYTMNAAPVYTNTVAQSQTNFPRLPVVTSIACYTGNFEYNDCLAEVMIKNPSGGAVATIMNSRYGIAQPPGLGPAERLDIRFYDFLFRQDSTILGAAHACSKDYYAPLARGSGGIWQWSLYELNLFGDPRMPVWTDEPFPLMVDYPRVLTLGTQVLSVRVLRNTYPFAGAIVRICKENDFEASAVTGSDGWATLDIAPQTPGLFTIVAVAGNSVPFRDSGFVRQSTPSVYPSRYWFSDSLGAFRPADGIINPGETISLSSWLRNFGDQTTTPLSVMLGSQDSAVQLSDSSRVIATLAPGESALVSGLTFQVAEWCTNGYLVSLALRVRDLRDTVWATPLIGLVGTSALRLAGYLVNDSPPLGNGNFRLDPGDTAQLILTVFNAGFGNGYSVGCRLRSTDPRLLVIDSLSGFDDIPRQQARANRDDPFVIYADSALPRETTVLCSLVLKPESEPEQRLGFLLPVGQIGVHDPIPDSGGPVPRYYAYDNEDTAYSAAPVFDWIEIRNRGINLNLTNDSTVRLRIPFTFRFYGQPFTALSICSNGWLAPGYTTNRNWTNRRLPDGNTPHNMICPNWDNLEPQSAGAVWLFYDTSHSRLIIEWDSVAYRDTADVREKFQVIIYDSTRATPTGDNEIVFQYQTANLYGSSTIGIENATSSVGICYLYDSAYHRAAAPILPGRAIRFTTCAPNAQLQEQPCAKPVSPLLTVQPTVGSHFVINFALPVSGLRPSSVLSVFDITGRCVFHFNHIPIAGGTVTWEGCNNQGGRLRTGTYFLVLRTPEQTVSHKILLLD